MALVMRSLVKTLRHLLLWMGCFPMVRVTFCGGTDTVADGIFVLCLMHRLRHPSWLPEGSRLFVEIP